MTTDASALNKFAALSPEKAALFELLLQKKTREAQSIHRLPRQPGAVTRAPISGAQQRLWFIDRLEGSRGAYHLSLAIELVGGLDALVLRQALDAVVARHEVLRTVFPSVDSEPVQEIRPAGNFALEIVDLSAASSTHAREELVTQHVRAALGGTFDLAAGPLIRGRLLRFASEEHVLLVTMHHMVWDGWSVAVFVRELAALYDAGRAGRPDPLSPLTIQYADYAHWQRNWVETDELRAKLDYWTEHLRGAPQLLELPTDRPRPATQTYRGATSQFTLDAELAAAIRTLARNLNLTLAMVLHAAWTILLSRLSGQQDVVIGIPVANRSRTEFEDLIGFFANTVAVRIRLEDDPTGVELLERAKESLLNAYAHQDVPFECVVEAIQPARSLSHSPVFQVMFVLQDRAHVVARIPELTLTGRRMRAHSAMFDLTLEMQESGASISGSLNYANDLFDATTIARWVDSFGIMLRALTRAPHLPVSQLPLMSESERRRVLETFNATQADYSCHQLLHRLFEEQVARAPDATAVAYEGTRLTYAELNARANRLARHLREQRVGPDRLVGVCVERSLEMVIALLGILKAGGAYVPIDPNYPVDRLLYMLEDAAPQVLLTQAALLPKLPPIAAEVFALDRDWDRIAKLDGDNLDVSAIGLQPHHLAYVIYTSGSTGKPKGAMNEHRAVVNRLLWMQQQYRLGEADAVLQKTPFSFDVSVWEFFWTLMTGARLIIARPQGHQDPSYLIRLIEQAGITTLHFVPSMLQVFLQQHDARQCVTLRRIVCSGEELPAALQNKCLELLPRAQLSNLYGPTEAAVDVTYWECVRIPDASRVPIGRPISNIRMYVLDQHLEPVPVGVAGDIYIGGVGVGRGYWNRPELTAERFVRHTFHPQPQARLYKTGDVGRWRADGAIEYLGRSDFQVKIRGFRIELGEIEARLAQHPDVKEAAVLARDEVCGDRRLVAYVVSARSGVSGVPAGLDDLRAHLRKTLPEYMIPSAFVRLEQMPLTPNGKLDRRALPAPHSAAYSDREYEPPQGEMEELLAGVWQALLGIDRIGRGDNFFELGGHSLLIVQMLERLRRVGLSVELRRVFENPALRDLAKALASERVLQTVVPPNLIPPACHEITPDMLPLISVDSRQIERIVAAVPGGAPNVQDIYPLAPLQEGILFHHLMTEGRGDTYVRATLLRVESRQRIDELIAALQAVIDRHDVLRTAVMWERLQQPVQVVCRRATLPVTECVLDPSREVAAQLQERLRPESQRIDLTKAPCVRLQVARDTRAGCWYALLQLHHMFVDAQSLSIVVREAVDHLRGDPVPCQEGRLYREHVAQAVAYGRTSEPEAFFRSRLADVDEPTAPFGLTNVNRDGSETAEAYKELEPTLARRIQAQARLLGTSAAILFHAAWSLVVARTSGRDDVVFGTVLLGRLQSSAGAQQILGMFINTLPLRIDLRGATARELVDRTQQGLVALLCHEQTSLAVAQRCSGVDGSAPLFTSLLNYRHSVPSANADWSAASGIEVVVANQGYTNYPIAVSVDDHGDVFGLWAQTDPKVDPRRVTAYLEEALTSLVDALERSSSAPALVLSVLPTSERRQLTELFNATQAEYPRERLVHELFEERVAQTPAAIAVVHDGPPLTYADLNDRANQLARYLRRRGVAAGDYVPILMPRSPQMLITQLAVLKLGAAYVPLDPELPSERRAFMIRDCGARCVVMSDAECSAADTQSVQHIACAATAADIAAEHAANLRVQLDATCPAYVMYTSGSTGVPKGVVVPHYAVNRLMINNGFVRVAPDDCLVHHSNPAFDASPFETWHALLNGARVLIVPQDVLLDGPRFARLLKEQGATFMYMSAGLFNQYIDAMVEVFPRLRNLFVGGDILDPNAIRRVLREHRPRRLFNAYGPTEGTTLSSTYLIDTLDEHASSIPIGAPMSNAQYYILNRSGQLVPIAVAGELYIGGDGVASGYLNRPELTAERFVPDPFSQDPAARLYKTGDLARWRADGVVEFLGRNDYQVKIRGFRVELGEIEARLLRHPQVREAAVLALQQAAGEKRVVAYVVPADPAGVPEIDDLRAHLRAVLPEYMVPSAFVVLEQMPLSATGKVNRRGLPAPDLSAYASGRFEAAQGAVEERLARIWQELLGIERIGRHNNFFHLGGHSLLALKALFAINRAFGATLRVTDLYKSPTICQLGIRLSGRIVDDDVVDLCREAKLEPHIVPPPDLPRGHVPPRAVLLTGATGFVGRFLLARLLRESDAILYCVVRAHSQSDAEQRLRGSLMKWNLWCDAAESRIRPVVGDLRLPLLGIDEPTYELLAREVDCIFHCATSMNHLESYDMAKPANVDSAREILRLATRSKLKLVNYMSTLGVFSPSPGSRRTVEEATDIDSQRHLASSGYTASKWVAEKIFAVATARGIPCNIFRLGLVWADTQQGRYDELQREYRLLKSCLLLGRGILGYRCVMPLTPVDYVARAVVALANRYSDGNGVFHISAAESMHDGLFEHLNEVAAGKLELIRPYSWLSEVRRHHESGRSLPIVPLLEDYFSLDERAFDESWQRLHASDILIDCARTQRELESAGIPTPVVDDKLVELCVQNMLQTDPQLREARRP